MEKLIRVRILDHEYLIKSDVDEVEIQEIARYVDNKLREIKSETNGLSEKNIAILAAFDIANEYFQVRKKGVDVVKNIQKRAALLNHQIDSIVVDSDR